MTKREFLSSLRAYLAHLPQAEADERIRFYAEMIDDRMEEGLSEEEAVAAVGTAEEVAAQIAEDIPFAKIAKECIKPKRRLAAWEIVLLVLGAPIWLSLFVAALAVVLSLYVSLWAIVIALWRCSPPSSRVGSSALPSGSARRYGVTFWQAAHCLVRG